MQEQRLNILHHTRNTVCVPMYGVTKQEHIVDVTTVKVKIYVQEERDRKEARTRIINRTNHILRAEKLGN